MSNLKQKLMETFDLDLLWLLGVSIILQGHESWLSHLMSMTRSRDMESKLVNW